MYLQVVYSHLEARDFALCTLHHLDDNDVVVLYFYNNVAELSNSVLVNGSIVYDFVDDFFVHLGLFAVGGGIIFAGFIFRLHVVGGVVFCYINHSLVIMVGNVLIAYRCV